MSERERMVTLLETIDDATISEILDMTLLFLARRRQQDEDARDLQIVNETMARIESGEEELISREELLEELGLTEGIQIRRQDNEQQRTDNRITQHV